MGLILWILWILGLILGKHLGDVLVLGDSGLVGSSGCLFLIAKEL